LQDSNLKDEQAQAILQSTDALRQLSKLNESLLLLAKIENNQFETTTEISIADVIQKYIGLFDEFIKEKRLNVQTIFHDSFTIQLHPLLADSLIINLLGNAIKYNYNGGTIVVEMDKNKFRISNTSALSPIPPDKLFMRLSTSNTNTEISHGLGLAIVKKIADVNHLNIEYHVENDIHTFAITKS
ncbi:MAG: ATP-binding protein, partial [Ginsengibacter sp.]